MILFKSATHLTSACGALVLLVAVAAAAQEQQAYETPESAAEALVQAAAAERPEAVAAVLGSEAEELGSGDPVADAAARREFAATAKEATSIEYEGEDRAFLTVGEEEWPFPIPLVRAPTGWVFDVEAGKEELFNRRIGRNELHAIAVAREFVEAQFEYAARDQDGDGAREFARKLMSTDGARDGLYWPTTEDEAESPMGRLVAEAVAEGYDPGSGGGARPYHGYYYRNLESQGRHASGGTRSYVKDGQMTEGFALIAYPAAYGNSGIMTFMVNHSGILYQKDLGEDTLTAATAITAYDPDKSWEPVTD